MRNFILVACFVGLLVSGSTVLAETRTVQFINSTISDENSNYIELRSGSRWELLTSRYVMTNQDVIIVLDSKSANDPRIEGTAYIEGTKIRVRRLSGDDVFESGVLTRVQESRLEGAILKLSDGTLLEIPEYDRYDTGWWLPPYDALLTKGGMYLWNLEKGKRVWVDRVINP
jgi:hypothetical protein